MMIALREENIAEDNGDNLFIPETIDYAGSIPKWVLPGFTDHPDLVGCVNSSEFMSQLNYQNFNQVVVQEDGGTFFLKITDLCLDGNKFEIHFPRYVLDPTNRTILIEEDRILELESDLLFIPLDLISNNTFTDLRQANLCIKTLLGILFEASRDDNLLFESLIRNETLIFANAVNIVCVPREVEIRSEITNEYKDKMDKFEEYVNPIFDLIGDLDNFYQRNAKILNSYGIVGALHLGILIRSDLSGNLSGFLKTKCKFPES